MTAEFAASDDAQALASFCERVKVNVDVTEKVFPMGHSLCTQTSEAC